MYFTQFLNGYVKILIWKYAYAEIVIKVRLCLIIW